MRGETDDKKARSYAFMRSMLDYAMGVLYLGVGLFMFFPEKLGFEMEGFDVMFRYIFGGICVVYGLWRVYRGIRKDY